MKRFRPDSLAPVELTRVPVMLNMGLSSSRELLQLVHQRVEESCRDILSRSADVNQDVRLITMARNDVPTSLNVLSNLIMDRMMSADERENAFFLLAKLADDLMQIGAIYMAGRVVEDLPSPITVRDIARKGGETRALKDEMAKKPVKEQFALICADLLRDNNQLRASELIREAKRVYGASTPALPLERQLSDWLDEAVTLGTVPPPRTDGRSKKVRKPAG